MQYLNLNGYSFPKLMTSKGLPYRIVNFNTSFEQT